MEATTEWMRPGVRMIEYQHGRTLDACGAYSVGVQARVETDAGPELAFAGLKDTGLDVYFDPFPSYHYDLEGRLSKIAAENRFWRRGLDNRTVVTERAPRGVPGPTRQTRRVDDEAATLFDEPAARIARWVAGLRALETRAADGGALEQVLDFARPNPRAALDTLLPLVERASRFDGAAAADSGETFRSIYRPITILPPDQYRALVLQATEGCAWNKCEFCGFYRDTRFRRRDPEEFREHVGRVRAFFGGDLALRTSVFVGQANAIMLPMDDLVPIFEIIGQEFPELTVAPDAALGAAAKLRGIYSFLDAFTTKHKTAVDYAELRRLGLRRVYIGMETGCETLLELLKKPATNEGLAHAMHALKEAGVSVGIILLAGVGGEEFAERHVAETLAAIRALPLGRDDLVFLSELVDYPGATYGDTAAASAITPLSDAAVAAQSKTLRREILGSFAKVAGPKVAPYRVEGFLYA